MAGALALILLAVAAFLPQGLPRGKKEAKLAQIWSTDARINRLSLARMFLFGARDVWFVVGVPVYFQSVLAKGGGGHSAFYLIGGFMALWTMAYGAVQAVAPQVLKAQGATEGAIVAKAILWAAWLTPIPLALAALAFVVPELQAWFTLALVAGLLLFGFVFAVNSSVHSYLILAFTRAERVSMDVGFYYMANAAGRLLGTALSGVSYQLGGLTLCLATAGAMAGASWLSARRLMSQTAR